MRRFASAGVASAYVVAAVIAGDLVSVIGGRGAVPKAWLLDGAIQGLVAALFAVGLLLVHTSGRIITFAHGAIALSAAILAFTLVGDGWSWWFAVPGSVVAASAIGIVIEAAVLRRFAASPRLVPTVATIGAGQLLISAAFLLPQWRFDVNLFEATTPDDYARLPGTQLHAPFLRSHAWHTSAVTFTADHLVAVVASLAALAGLGAFLRWTRSGTAIRAAAENGERAAQLGIGTGTLGTIVWAFAGGLAGLGAVLAESLHGSTLLSVAIGGGAASALLRVAAAVLGRMVNLPRTIAAAIALTIFERCVFWGTGRTAVSDLALLIVIGGSLLLQRRQLSRTEEAAASTWAAVDEIRPVPSILRALPAVQTARRWVVFLGAAVVVGYPFAMSPSQVYLGATYAIYGIVAVSLVVLTGWGGQISLGQFGLVAVGASVGGSLTANAHVPFPIAAILASTLGAGVAVLLGLPALRIRGLYLAVTTLAFAVVMSTFVLDRSRFPTLVPEHVNRPRIGFLRFEDERAFYFLALGGLVLSVFAALGLRRTRTGRVLIAMRDNERAAQSFGISLVRTRLVTFGISGFLAAFAGVLLVHQSHTLRPDAYAPQRSLQMFLMAVIGGLGSVSGVLTGAIYLGSAGVIVPGVTGQLMASGGGVLLVLLFYPSGLGGIVYATRDAWLRRIAIREKIFVRSLLGDVRDLGSERSRAPLAPKTAPEPEYELVGSTVRTAGSSQRGKGWVYE